MWSSYGQRTGRTSMSIASLHLIQRYDGEFERVCYAELLIPDTPNHYGDITTREMVREFAYEFARQGYGVDVNHDGVNVQGTELVIVESFITRPGDPDFIEGSWVVGMKILSDDLWNQVLAGTLNGFSFEAECYMTPILIQNLKNRQVTGETEPDLIDGHTHPYLVLLDPLNNPISGGTGETNGHSHRITTHTVTGVARAFGGVNHSHRYQVIVDENEDDIIESTGDSYVTGT